MKSIASRVERIEWLLLPAPARSPFDDDAASRGAAVGLASWVPPIPLSDHAPGGAWLEDRRLAVYPAAKFDEASAAEREGHWAGEWERRFV